MPEELNLVRDLAVILISASVFTVISKALKQPLILGYIIAGFLVGPHIDFFPGISSVEAVDQWSEIGIIFLMFGLGLEFSFKKLLKVGSSALIIAGCKFIGVFVIGFVAGTAMGWTTMESIFLAGLLSMSSTTVVIKSYDEMGLKSRPHASLVFGTLVVEDLIAILLMVLLSTMAVSNRFAGAEMLFNLVKLAFFIILWFLVGIFVIPSLLKRARKFLSDETLLVISIGLCFGMVALAGAVGFSSALGAFVMGSILAETIESEHIQKITSPIKDLFGAVFFVSVGMKLSPAVIAEHWFIIIVLTLVVMLTHILFAGAGVLMTGKGLENAVHTGFSLAQLGEFGFIIVGVGVGLGVMRDFIYPVIIAVSVITTFTTPYMIKAAGPAYRLLCRKLPESILQRLQMEDEQHSSVAEQSEWRHLIQAYAIRVVLYSVILLAIMILSQQAGGKLIAKIAPSWPSWIASTVLVSTTLALMSPFLYGLAVSTGSINAPALKLLKEKRSNRWPILGLIFLRIFIAIGFVLAVISSHFKLSGWAFLVIVIAGILFFLIARRYMNKYSFIEKRFLVNLNEKEASMKRKAPVTTSINDKLSGYNVRIESISIAPESCYTGMRMKELPFRAESGANIIKIKRGSLDIIIPSADEFLYPGDEILAVGTPEQLEALKNMIDASVETANQQQSRFKVMPLTLTAESQLTGKTIHSLQLRSYRCTIISVIRADEIITNPRADLRLAEGDVVWIAGEESGCDWFA